MVIPTRPFPSCLHHASDTWPMQPFPSLPCDSFTAGVLTPRCTDHGYSRGLFPPFPYIMFPGVDVAFFTLLPPLKKLLFFSIIPHSTFFPPYLTIRSSLFPGEETSSISTSAKPSPWSLCLVCTASVITRSHLFSLALSYTCYSSVPRWASIAFRHQLRISFPLSVLVDQILLEPLFPPTS